MVRRLLDVIDGMDLNDYSELLFNLYEDTDAYSIEAVLDDDELIIGREDQRFAVEKDDGGYELVLNETSSALKTYFKENKEKYKHFKCISYGFVDGDLYYIKKPRKKKEQIHFTKEDFYSFDAFRISAWLTVYLNAEGKEIYGDEVFETDFNTLSSKDLYKWCEILANYFDYQKYNKN